MSDLQPPPPPPQGGSGGPPRPGWNPTALSASGQASYVGRTSTPDPASEDPQGAPAINKFAPRRSLVPVLLTVVTILIAAAVVYAAANPAAPAPSPSATAPSPTPTVSTTPRAGTPFAVSYTDITGVWQITKHQWSARGLDIYVEVSVDTGDLNCMFNALSASGEQARDATPSQLSPNFVTGMIGAGEQRSGWVHLPLTERGTALVFLHTPSQGQVSGIEVSG